MVHCFKKNGYSIVLDVNSGTVHEVDDVAFDIIKTIDEKTSKTTSLENISDSLRHEIVQEILRKYNDRQDVNEEELNQTLDDIEQLIKDGQLFSKDIFENIWYESICL